MRFINPDKIEEFKYIQNELDSTLESINNLEKDLDILLEEYYKYKIKYENLYYRLYLREKSRPSEEKRTKTDIKEAVKSELALNEDYLKYLEYEEKKELVKRKIRLLQAKVDVLKLKFETLKY